MVQIRVRNEYRLQGVDRHTIQEWDKESLSVSDIIKEPPISGRPHKAGIALADVQEINAQTW
ncbi:MAG: hypothetical protein ABIW76_19525 [Fibrobacteria bacterium]